MDTPTGIVVDERADGLEMRVRWWNQRCNFLVVSYIGLIAVTFLALSRFPGTAESEMPFAALAIFPYGLFVLWYTFYLLLFRLNTTVFTIRANLLIVKSVPVPFPPAQSIPLEQVLGFFLHERKLKGWYWDTSYELIAALRGDRTTKLLRSLDAADKIHYVKNRVTPHLPLKEVPDETARIKSAFEQRRRRQRSVNAALIAAVPLTLVLAFVFAIAKAVLYPPSDKELETECSSGKVSSCFALADRKRHEGAAALSLTYYRRSCDLGSAPACYTVAQDLLLEGDSATAQEILTDCCQRCDNRDSLRDHICTEAGKLAGGKSETATGAREE